MAYKKDPSPFLSRYKKWAKNNRPKLAAGNRRYTARLRRGYIVTLLRRQLKLRTETISDELIERKRCSLEQKRLRLQQLRISRSRCWDQNQISVDLSSASSPSKCCSVCGQRKPLSDYYADKNRPDGHHSWCKPCHGAGIPSLSRWYITKLLRRQLKLKTEEISEQLIEEKRRILEMRRRLFKIKCLLRTRCCSSGGPSGDISLPVSPLSKCCSQCRQRKPLSDYYAAKNRPDGHHSWCKKCHNLDTGLRDKIERRNARPHAIG